MFNNPINDWKLGIGFPSQNQFQIVHNGPSWWTIDVTHFGDFHLYTICFNNDDNIMIVRRNGHEIRYWTGGNVEIPDNTQALLGVGPHATGGPPANMDLIIDIAEIKTYLTALPEEICEIEENALKDKYGL